MTASPTLPNVERANRLLAKAWRSRLLPEPRLEPEALLKAALKGRSAKALGPREEWREPFHRLVEGLTTSAELNPLGRAMAHGQLIMMLRSRIRAVGLWKEHPNILARPVTAPVVILGQMRSGTTRLQRLLACDPRFGFTRLHESLIPVPFSRRPGAKDRRRAMTRFGLAMLRRFNPVLDTIHPSDADQPDEEFGLFSFSFGSAQFEAQWRVRDFARWWEGSDRAWLYQEFRALLQTAAWSCGDRPGRPILLKAPQFLQDMPAFAAVFPDARYIRLEREPAAIVASSASLVWNQMRVQSDRATPQWVGQEWLRKSVLRQKIVESYFSKHSAPAVSVGFNEMNVDWLAAIRRIYDFLQLPLGEETIAAMHRYLAASTAHLGHVYRLEDFRLTREKVDAAFRSSAWNQPLMDDARAKRR